MTDDQIKHMANRFLGWKLPQNFHPDNGISYQRPNYHPSVDATPVGTNLLTATQAEAMVRYMAEGLPTRPEQPADEPVDDLHAYRISKTDPYEANARLIAAAPDLLAAIKLTEQTIIAMMTAIADGDAEAGLRFAAKDPAVIAARAAIARAHGAA